MTSTKRRTKLNYSQGSCFLVPLRDGGFGRVVVARFDRRGVVFGYFFGPRLSSSGEADRRDISPDRAVLRSMFGDLFMIRGQWSDLGQLEGWRSEEWPMPPLIRVDDATGRATLSYYDDRTFECLREEEVSPESLADYPYDSTMGAGAAEIRLTMLLSADNSLSDVRRENKP